MNCQWVKRHQNNELWDRKETPVNPETRITKDELLDLMSRPHTTTEIKKRFEYSPLTHMRGTWLARQGIIKVFTNSHPIVWVVNNDNEVVRNILSQGA